MLRMIGKLVEPTETAYLERYEFSTAHRLTAARTLVYADYVWDEHLAIGFGI
jgi:hypothetical protein